MIKRKGDSQIAVLAVFLWLILAIIIGRLFYLQIIRHSYYQAWATSTHEIYQQLFSKRGNVYVQDSRADQNKEYPVAVQRPYYLVYAVPREINKSLISSTTEYLSKVFNYNDDQKKDLEKKLSKKDDPYEPIENKVLDDKINILKSANLIGIKYVRKDYRYYPENSLLGAVLGFVGYDIDGQMTGRYGIEGRWNKELEGKSGFLSAQRSAAGSFISLAGKTVKTAENGVDLLLTIDRALQNNACTELREGVETYKAKSGSLVMLDAKTGAILVMCSYPDFDSNNYSQVTDVDVYNNSNIFTAYEVGSVFKPITMVIGLDLDLVTPTTLFNDPGIRLIDGYKIYNAQKKSYGMVDMTSVLDNSINTGVIWVQEKIGQERFKKYVENFGFGKKTGVKINNEVAGDITSLYKPAAVYAANASFGQGFTATPLQLAASYTALANDGKLLKPYIIKEVRYPNGKIDKTEIKVIDTVISSRAQKLITGMLISVIENGHGYMAKMDDFYVAGKTGTAQIASVDGGYSESTNHTFVGYFPANNPRFVMVVKYEAPQRAWAESTAAPTFKKVAEFAVKYYALKGDK